MRRLRLSERRDKTCFGYPERKQARPKVNLGEAHRKHVYQLMANELGLSHVVVSLVYMGLQFVVSFGFVWGCGALASYLGCSLVLVHWVYLICALVLLAVAYVVFKKKYYWMHEEYLKGLGK